VRPGWGAPGHLFAPEAAFQSVPDVPDMPGLLPHEGLEHAAGYGGQRSPPGLPAGGGPAEGEPPAKRLRWEQPAGAPGLHVQHAMLPFWPDSSLGGDVGAAGLGPDPGGAGGAGGAGAAPPPPPSGAPAGLNMLAWQGLRSGAGGGADLGLGFQPPPGAVAPWGLQPALTFGSHGSEASAATGSNANPNPTQLSIAGRDASASGSGSLTSRCGSGPLLGMRPPTPWTAPEGLMRAGSLGGRSGSAGRSGSLGGRSGSGPGLNPALPRAASLGASGGRSGNLAGGGGSRSASLVRPAAACCGGIQLCGRPMQHPNWRARSIVLSPRRALASARLSLCACAQVVKL